MTLIQQIKQLIDDSEITQSQIAKEIGFSGGAVSAFLKGTYKGDNDKLTHALSDWLSNRERKVREVADAPAFVETKTATDVFNRLDFGRMVGELVIIHGASGVGKTQAAKHYRDQYNNVWMITVSPSRSTLNEVLYEIALALGMNDAPRRKGRLARELTKKLTGSQGLLIIDEADHLPYDALEELRIMQDETQIGLALIGNDKVYNRLRGGMNQAHEFARLWSRMGRRLSIQKTKKADIKVLAEAWGLDCVDKQLMTALYEIGQSAGGLRVLTKYLRLAAMTAKGLGQIITLELILAAKAQMEGDA